jgi:simple sugar transport system ATP-binding protein
MLGHSSTLAAKTPAKPGDNILTVKDLAVHSEDGRAQVKPISFCVRAGEIVAFAGVAGNGQHELFEALSGLRLGTGRIHLNGCDISRCTIRQRRLAGLAYIPEDRRHTGLAVAAGIAENLLPGRQRRLPFAVYGWLRCAAIKTFAAAIVHRYRIQPARIDTSPGTLSGGNQQKLMLARELEHNSALLLVEQPTRGVDIGAGEFIHQQLLAARDRGTALVLVSSELSEIRRLADRILVMVDGRIIAERNAAALDEYELGRLLAGAADGAAALA